MPRRLIHQSLHLNILGWRSLLMLGCCALVPVQAADRERVIEEIVVTAQKTQESLQDVPISISALSGKFMQENGIGDLVEASLYVPNVRVEFTSPSSPQVFIRGFGTNTFNPSFEPAVGLVQDDIFFGRGTYFTQSMYDLERIEVLRGPQGTLFGKNTIAGVFNVTSRSAPMDQGSEANLSYKLEDFGDQRIEGGIGYRGSANFGVRVSAMAWDRAGRMSNSKLGRKEDNRDQDALRLKLQWEPLDQASVETILQRSETTVNFWPRQLMNLDQDTRDYLVNFDPKIEDDPLDFQTSFDNPGELFQASETAQVRGTWAFDDALGLSQLESTLILGLSWLEVEQFQDLDVSPADLLNLNEVDDYSQTSLEWRFSGEAASLFGFGQQARFIAGVFYFQSDFHIVADVTAGQDIGSYAGTKDAQQLLSGETNVPGNPLGGLVGGVLPPLLDFVSETDYYRFDYFQDVSAYAAFGQISWDITDKWVLTPGLRINREEKVSVPTGTSVCTNKDVLQQVDGMLAANTRCITASLMGANDYAPGPTVRVEENISPKLTLSYYFNSDVSVFGSLTRGFKSGGVNAISFTGDELEFEPEQAQSYELGLRSQWLNNTLRFNATAFRMDFDNLQVLAFNGLFFDVTNAATAYSEGLETDIQWLTPFQPLSINASLGYLRARYASYPDAPAPISEGIGALQDLSGKTLAFAPKLTGTLSPTLDFELGGFGLKAIATLQYRDAHYTDTDLDEATRIPATTTYAAHVSLTTPDDRWTLTVGGKNLTDERTLNQVIDTAMFPGTYNPSQNPGRLLYGAIKVSW
ncbi:MAG: TonB-dependent receptor [Oceanococcus sp.]